VRETERLCRIFGLEHRVAEALEQRVGDRADLRFIFDQQNGFVAARRCQALLASELRAFAAHLGQVHREATAAARLSPPG
jgi:hypothetical protein